MSSAVVVAAQNRQIKPSGIVLCGTAELRSRHDKPGIIHYLLMLN